MAGVWLVPREPRRAPKKGWKTALGRIAREIGTRGPGASCPRHHSVQTRIESQSKEDRDGQTHALSCSSPSRSSIVRWMLEETGEPYDLHLLKLAEGEQMKPITSPSSRWESAGASSTATR